MARTLSTNRIVRMENEETILSVTRRFGSTVVTSGPCVSAAFLCPAALSSDASPADTNIWLALTHAHAVPRLPGSNDSAGAGRASRTRCRDRRVSILSAVLVRRGRESSTGAASDPRALSRDRGTGWTTATGTLACAEVPTLRFPPAAHTRPPAERGLSVSALSTRPRAAHHASRLSSREEHRPAPVSRASRGPEGERSERQLLELWRTRRPFDRLRVRALRFAALAHRPETGRRHHRATAEGRSIHV